MKTAFTILAIFLTATTASAATFRTHGAEAIAAWRKYWELEDHVQPERVITVPTATAPGVIEWDAISQHKPEARS